MLIPLYCNVEETNIVGDTIITLIPEHVQGISIEIVLVMDRPNVDTDVLQSGYIPRVESKIQETAYFKHFFSRWCKYKIQINIGHSGHLKCY